jgi:hypothetical protein
LSLGIAATFCGVSLERRVATERFYNLILALTFLIALKLSLTAPASLQIWRNVGAVRPVTDW